MRRLSGRRLLATAPAIDVEADRVGHIAYPERHGNELGFMVAHRRSQRHEAHAAVHFHAFDDTGNQYRAVARLLRILDHVTEEAGDHHAVAVLRLNGQQADFEERRGKGIEGIRAGEAFLDREGGLIVNGDHSDDGVLVERDEEAAFAFEAVDEEAVRACLVLAEFRGKDTVVETADGIEVRGGFGESE